MTKGRPRGLSLLSAVCTAALACNSMLACGDAEPQATESRQGDAGSEAGGSDGDGGTRNRGGTSSGGDATGGTDDTTAGEGGAGQPGTTGGTSGRGGTAGEGGEADGGPDASECGDGAVEGTERCDDGNAQSGDGCSAGCTVEPGWACDGSEPTECSEICGDGRVVGAEAVAGGCDDDNTTSDDGCSSTCRVEDGWMCAGQPSACQRGCGNGEVTGTEECDDGNAAASDGCFACAVENGWTCTGAPSSCRTTCGDGVRAGAEECDDDNIVTEPCAYGQSSCMVCDSTCHSVAGSTRRCGDGVINTSDGETCDQGNAVAGDGCSATCTLEAGWICSGAPTVCSRPSCQGLAATCGPSGNADCCASSVVPGGTYNRMNQSAYPATVGDFRLDTYEITVGRFRKFWAAYPASKPMPGSGRNPRNPGDQGWDAAWTNTNLASDQAGLDRDVSCSGLSTWTGSNDSRPMNCINRFQAFAFCIWDGGRLPTEAEWNYAAAGGSEQRQYPWSSPPSNNTISPQHASYDCNGDGITGGACLLADILPVGTRPLGNGRWGQADMAGNLREWTRDSGGTQPTPCTDCANFTDPATRTTRGGHYGSPTTALLSYGDLLTIGPIEYRTTVGARCARAVP